MQGFIEQNYISRMQILKSANYTLTTKSAA